MKLQQLEARVLEIVETVRAGRKVEDDRVELKATWPTDLPKTARQLAGHANASGGEPVLWIIGLDENRCQVAEVSQQELSEWWPKVVKWFDGDPPDLTTLLVPVAAGERVAALRFDTSRAPYVVHVEGGGRVQLEVPWRSGNQTRSARRREILASVVEQAQVPELELVSGTLLLEEQIVHPGDIGVDPKVVPSEVHAFWLSSSLTIFVSATGLAMLPQHRQRWTVRSSRVPSVSLGRVDIRGPFRLRDIMRGLRRESEPAGYIDVLDRSGLVVQGSGEITIESRGEVHGDAAREILDAGLLDLHVELPVDRTRRSSRLQATFGHVPGSKQLGPKDEYKRHRWTVARFEAVESP